MVILNINNLKFNDVVAVISFYGKSRFRNEIFSKNKTNVRQSLDC